MQIDYSKGISIYELIALGLSILAILIPAVKWAWHKWVVKPKLDYLPTGSAYLFFNKSGSYIEVDGVFEAKNKPISLKNIKLKVNRKIDDKALNLTWSTFKSPVNQKIAGNFTSTSETAHPFRIDAESIVPVFIEFTDFFDTSGKKFEPYDKKLFKEIDSIIEPNLMYNQAKDKYMLSSLYSEAKTILEKELFWDIGEYKIILQAEYGKITDTFEYEFSVEQEQHSNLEHNLEETLLSILKDRYNLPYSFIPIKVQIKRVN